MPGMRMSVQVQFITPMLGTAPLDPESYEKWLGPAALRHVAAADLEEELDTVRRDDDEAENEAEDEEQPVITGFRRLNGDCFVYDYQVKGFLKEAARTLNRLPESRTQKRKAFLKVLEGLVMVEPREIWLVLPEGKELSLRTRPLRASTPKGERIALATSEEAPEGTRMDFVLDLLDDRLAEWMRELLDHGKRVGFGQWRTGGFGRFTYVLE